MDENEVEQEMLEPSETPSSNEGGLTIARAIDATLDHVTTRTQDDPSTQQLVENGSADDAKGNKWSWPAWKLGLTFGLGGLGLVAIIVIIFLVVKK